MLMRPSYRPSLVRVQRVRKIEGVPYKFNEAAARRGRRASVNHVTTAIHRFQESIAGRSYQIEVAAVSKDRWRAYIVRIPGVPTALMPFYGATPLDAAEQLTQWLTRAHELAAASSTKKPSVVPVR